MGKICPQCGYHFLDEPIYQYPPKFGCEHEFYIDTPPQQGTNAGGTKWRCKKCLETKITYD